VVVLRSKKASERAILDQFRSLYADFPRGRIKDSESPDFLLQIRPRYTIGIELVELMAPDDARTMIPNEINRCIADKNEKMPLYQKKRLDRYWLLIYTRYKGQWPGNRMDRLLEDLPHNSFHGIFILRTLANEIIVLK
jgi:hypothetical protein